MEFALLKRLTLCGLLLFCGGCTATGLVAEDVDLALTDVSVVSRSNSYADPEILHNMREEVLYELSKAPLNSVEPINAHLVLDIREFPERVTQSGSVTWSAKTVSGSGQLFDLHNGKKLGEFTWKGREGQSQFGTKQNIHSEKQTLLSFAARDVLTKIYGSARAQDYTSRHGRYARVPYMSPTRLAMASNYPSDGYNQPGRDGKNIGGLRLSIAEGVLPPEFIGPPDPSTLNKKPKVISAPQLPIQ